MAEETVVVTYTPCPDCRDGSCGQCGLASSEHAGPGVLLTVTRLRFVRCPSCKKGCDNCGPKQHPMALPGICTEVVREHNSKRWVPSMHMHDTTSKQSNATVCGSHAPERLVTAWAEVTCRVCLKRRKQKKTLMFVQVRE